MDGAVIPAVNSTCSCFSLCSEQDARSFHLRLPSVVATSSPWFTYLRHVYAERNVSLPINLQTFELFYLNLLPVNWRCHSGTDVHDCPVQVCRAWLSPEMPNSTAIQEHRLKWQLRPYQWHRSHLPRLLRNHTLRFLPRHSNALLGRLLKSPVLVEVVRHSFPQWVSYCAQGRSTDPMEWVGDRILGAAEGVQYGCWFSPSVGSGVFLPLRRPLVLHDRVEVESTLPDVARFSTAKARIFTSSSNISTPIHHNDCLYASLTRLHGYDALVVLESVHDGAAEIVVVTPECMHQTHPLQTACMPSQKASNLARHVSTSCL